MPAWTRKPISQLTDSDMEKIKQEYRFSSLLHKLAEIQDYFSGMWPGSSPYRERYWRAHEEHINRLTEEAKNILNQIWDAKERDEQ